jgi:hypothetical protein
MKPWHILVLVYLLTGIAGVELSLYNLPISADIFMAAGLTLLGYQWIRKLQKLHNPNK